MAGRYKKPFEKLKQQLKEELEEFLRLFILDGLQFRDDDEGRQLVDEINRAFREGQIGKRVGRAAFREFDLEKIKQIAQEHRQKVEGKKQGKLTQSAHGLPRLSPQSRRRPGR